MKREAKWNKKALTQKGDETKNKKGTRHTENKYQNGKKLLLINKALIVTGSKYSLKRQVLAEWNKLKIRCNSMLLQECHFIYK